MVKKPRNANKKIKVILDSNALLVPLQFRIDIFEELRALLGRKVELVLLSPIKRELEKLAEKGSPKMRKLSSYALELAEKCVFLAVDSGVASSADDTIVEVAKKGNYLVFTNDRKLRKRLRDISVPVIYVRQKSRLEIDGRLFTPV